MGLFFFAVISRVSDYPGMPARCAWLVHQAATLDAENKSPIVLI